MPRVSRVKKKATRKKKTGGVRDLFQLVNEERLGLRVVMYGEAKTGKTTLACDFPKPLLLVGTTNSLEDGRLSIAHLDGIDFLPLEESIQLDEACSVCVEDNYKSIILDTGGGLQDLILKEHLGLKDIPVSKNWGMAKQQDWQAVGAQTKERLRQLLSLGKDEGINAVIVAHERVFKSDEDSDYNIKPSIGAALTPSVTSWLNGACDLICQTLIRGEVETQVQKIAGKEIESSVKTGEIEYCLRVLPDADGLYSAGYYGPKRKKGEAVDIIVDPTYKRIIETIRG